MYLSRKYSLHKVHYRILEIVRPRLHGQFFFDKVGLSLNNMLV